MSITDKLKTIAENEPKIYDAGYDKGYDEGRKAQYDLFWDKFQRWDSVTQTTKRTDYRRAFAYWYLANAIFKPKYDVVPEGDASYMFWNFRTQADLRNITNMNGDVINFDFSKVTVFTNMFETSLVQHIGIIDCSSTTSLNQAFNNPSNSIKTIEKLIVHEGITTYSSCFANSTIITNLTIEGVIAASFNISSHPNLTLDSLKSIITHLKDFSGTDKAFTKTLTLNAKCWETLNADGANSPNGTTWAEYVFALGWNY